MIRASALQIAEKCGLAPALAEQYPESSAAAARGHGFHTEIAAGRHPEAAALIAAHGGLLLGHELFTQLHDPETGDLITQGTADIAWRCGGDIDVYDWKSGRPENVPRASENLQLHAYGLALALQHGADAYQVAPVFVDDGKAFMGEPCHVAGAEMWTMLERIKKAGAAKPEARPGPHCGECYQRFVCPSYRERARTALILLPLSTVVAIKGGETEDELTDAKAVELVMRIKAVRDACAVAEDIAKAHVNAGGRIEADGKTWAAYPVAGRRSGPSVAECEKAGLEHMIKAGKPSERWEWRNAK